MNFVHQANLKTAASEYISRGWKVLILHSIKNGACTCSKKGDCTSPGKHPRTQHGVLDATRDFQKVENWLRDFPDSNLGIATGLASGIFVMDIDFRNDGDMSLGKLESTYGKLPDTVESITGGGRHIYFDCQGKTISNSKSRVGLGIDIKADGGYVVAPPSIHYSGREYAWDLSVHPADTKVVSAPDWLVNEIQRTEATNGQSREKWRAAFHDVAPNGSRNHTITSLTGHLFRKFVDPHVVLDLMLAWNRTHSVPSLPDGEVNKIVRSIAQRELARRGAGRHA